MPTIHYHKRRKMKKKMKHWSGNTFEKQSIIIISSNIYLLITIKPLIHEIFSQTHQTSQ